jgi:hypothetical protein
LRSWRIRSYCAVLLAALLPACGGGVGSSGPVVPGTAPAPAAAPADAVERFMRLIAARDYLAMGHLFGTVEGPITSRDPQQQVERRMYAIARILENERFVIRPGEGIPGRGPEVTQVAVQITQQGRTKEVPFVVVRSASGGWLVEQVDLQAVTRFQ